VRRARKMPAAANLMLGFRARPVPDRCLFGGLPADKVYNLLTYLANTAGSVLSRRLGRSWHVSKRADLAETNSGSRQ
jgi:hypothetical protein